MALPWASILGGASLATGLGSLLFPSSAGADAAKKAAKEARKMRDWYEGKARETSHKLNAELESMRTLRSLDMPAYQASAQIAQLQRQKGSERVGRQRMLGGLDRSTRDAVFGGQLTQYLGRENQRLGRYAGMTKQIFDMASQGQAQVNQMLQAGGAQYGQMMGQANQMAYNAEVATGNKWGKALGALSQGLSMASQGFAQKEALAEQRKYQEGQVAEQRDFIRELYGTSPAGAAEAAGGGGGGYMGPGYVPPGNPQAPGGGGGYGFGMSGSTISPNMYGLDPMVFSQFMMGGSPTAFGPQQGY